MDWFILICLVPLIVIPVVLLAGFAGCSFSPSAVLSVPAPSNLVATAVSDTEIDLSWTDNAVNTTLFRINRSENGAPPVMLTIGASPGVNQFRTDPGLNPATTYEYQVFAIVVDQTSDGSNLASATTLSWQTTFNQGPTVTVGTDDGGFKGRCMVQRLPKESLLIGGNKVRLTLRGSSTGNLNLDAVYISRVAATGDPYDSAADLTQVHFAGSASVNISPNTSVLSDVVAYQLDTGQDLLIAFDVDPGNGSGGTRKVPLNNARLYYRAATTEADQADRTSGYNGDNANMVFNVEKIEVLA